MTKESVSFAIVSMVWYGTLTIHRCGRRLTTRMKTVAASLSRLVSLVEIILVIALGILLYWLYMGVKAKDRIQVIIAVALIVLLTLLVTGGVNLTNLT